RSARSSIRTASTSAPTTTRPLRLLCAYDLATAPDRHARPAGRARPPARVGRRRGRVHPPWRPGVRREGLPQAANGANGREVGGDDPPGETTAVGPGRLADQPVVPRPDPAGGGVPDAAAEGLRADPAPVQPCAAAEMLPPRGVELPGAGS